MEKRFERGSVDRCAVQLIQEEIVGEQPGPVVESVDVRLVPVPHGRGRERALHHGSRGKASQRLVCARAHARQRQVADGRAGVIELGVTEQARQAFVEPQWQAHVLAAAQQVVSVFVKVMNFGILCEKTTY